MSKLKLAALVMISALVLAGCTGLPSVPGLGGATATPTAAASDSTGDDNGTSGGVKSTSWPADVPTPSDAYDYTYAKYNGAYYLGFSVKLNGRTPVALHNTIIASLKAAGWNGSADNVLETDEGATQTLTKDANLMTIGTSLQSSGDDFASVGIIIQPNTEGN